MELHNTFFFNGFFYDLMNNRNLFYPKTSGDSKNNGHHGILEFSTEKAGQDVTPMNLDFPDTSNGTHSQKRAMNSISGKCLNLTINIM